MTDTVWPHPPANPDAALELYKAQLEAVKAERDRIATLEDAAQKATDDLLAAVHAAYIDVSKAAIDRSLQRATFLTTAAGTIVTLYTGLLALVYSVGTNPLPARGLVPALFIGGAFAFSSAYVAFLRRKTMRGNPLPAGLGGDIDERRLLTFIAWVSASVQHRAWALRTAVVSLAIGVALLPLPFLQLRPGLTLAVTLVAFGLLASWIVFGELVGVARIDWTARRRAAGVQARNRPSE